MGGGYSSGGGDLGGRGDVDSAVLLPAILGLIGADRALLAVADQAELVGRNAHLDQKFLRGARTAPRSGVFHCWSLIYLDKIQETGPIAVPTKS